MIDSRAARTTYVRVHSRPSMKTTMKLIRVTEKQIVSISKEADGCAQAKYVCRCHAVCDVTYYSWKSKRGGASASALERKLELVNWLKQPTAARINRHRATSRLEQEYSYRMSGGLQIQLLYIISISEFHFINISVKGEEIKKIL